METIPRRDDVRAKIVEFNGNNFEIWKFSVHIALRSHNLVSIVDGTRKKPTEVCIHIQYITLVPEQRSQNPVTTLSGQRQRQCGDQPSTNRQMVP